MQQFTNLAFTEGWARYAEGIAEEVGILSSADARIQRRLASQGLLIDPGLHAFHWTRQQAIDSLVGTGRYSPSRAENVVRPDCRDAWLFDGLRHGPVRD